MTMHRTLILGTLVVAAAMVALPSQAAFVVIDTFDDLELGPIDDQNDWYAADVSSEVTLDPADPANQVLSVLTASTILRHQAVVPPGEARMFFLRFRYENQLSISFGLSAASAPSQFDHFEVELSLTNAHDDLRINDGGTYEDLTSLQQEQWFNCWLYVDNAADITTVWLHDRPGESATAADRLVLENQDTFEFRDGTTSDLKNIFIKTGGGSGVDGPLILDDLYLQDSNLVDLSNPTSSISAVTSPPATVHLSGARPNPFNPQTTIAFNLDESQSVALAVYDLNGRYVRQLVAGGLNAGPHAVAWDGRNERGAAVSSGVYIARLTGRREASSVKLVLAR